MKSLESVKFRDEQYLISECGKQNRLAQKYLYEKYYSRMYVLCIRYMKSRDEAEDVLQEGFVTIFSKIDTYSGEGSFEGWMRKIFVNTALMKLRKKDFLKESVDVTEVRNVSFEPGILESIGGKEIMQLIASMPTGFRTVFNMNIIEGYSHKEIAEALGISEGTSRSQLNRARMWLQEKIRQMEEKR